MKILFNDPSRYILAKKEELTSAFENFVVSGSYVLGPKVEEFEKEFGDLVGVGKLVVLLVIPFLTCLAQVILNQTRGL
jgi:dTDP-4-amino-4,6-dideoxygalactose transaminase